MLVGRRAVVGAKRRRTGDASPARRIGRELPRVAGHRQRAATAAPSGAVSQPIAGAALLFFDVPIRHV
ncbi:hypothetical protein ACRAWF_04255 [Streptomyces sp. L7]